MSRGRKGLSDEDRALWEQIAKTAKPLKASRRTKLAPVQTVQVDAAGKPAPPKPAKIKRAALPPLAPAPPKLPIPQAPKLTSLTRREKRGIAKGAKSIDGKLDLHGMTQAEAHTALDRFLHRKHAEGAGLVVVVTGKGSGQPGGRGVLRQQVPHWLALPDMRAIVLGFEEAHIGHGGGGALYVRLRRARTRDVL